MEIVTDPDCLDDGARVDKIAVHSLFMSDTVMYCWMQCG
jgi:hypothetical protein